MSLRVRKIFCLGLWFIKACFYLRQHGWSYFWSLSEFVETEQFKISRFSFFSANLQPRRENTFGKSWDRTQVILFRKYPLLPLRHSFSGRNKSGLAYLKRSQQTSRQNLLPALSTGKFVGSRRNEEKEKKVAFYWNSFGCLVFCFFQQRRII